MSDSPYENDRIVNEYLLFHYGSHDEVLPYSHGPCEALDFAVRCVSESIDPSTLPRNARALDLGCAVGRSSFELTRYCKEVIGIDYSRKFIDAARTLQREGLIHYERIDEGELTTPLRAYLPDGTDPDRVSFLQADAQALPADLGDFELVLMANLIDRLADPWRCLERLPGLVRSGGRLIITSPYTWLPEFTPIEKWVGGKRVNGEAVTTEVGLKSVLEGRFDFLGSRDVPFLIREHARKFQWSVAQATIWVRR